MISQFSALLLRRRCVAQFMRSRMLCMPAVASRTPAVTKARVSIQDTRIWHLTVVSVGLLGMVLLILFFCLDIFHRIFRSDLLDARYVRARRRLSRGVIHNCGHDDTSTFSPHRQHFLRL
jgi:hypothetical protein